MGRAHGQEGSASAFIPTFIGKNRRHSPTMGTRLSEDVETYQKHRCIAPLARHARVRATAKIGRSVARTRGVADVGTTLPPRALGRATGAAAPVLGHPSKKQPKRKFHCGSTAPGSCRVRNRRLRTAHAASPASLRARRRKWQHRHRLPYHHSSCGCGGASWRSVDMLASTQKFGRASRGREYKVSTSWRGLQQYQGLGSRLMALPIANSAEFNTSIQSLQP